MELGTNNKFFVRSIDHGLRTADDTCRVELSVLEGIGAKLPDYIRPIMDLEGWCDDPDESTALYDLCWELECADGSEYGAHWYVDNCPDAGMTWIYDLRTATPDELDEFAEAIEREEPF